MTPFLRRLIAPRRKGDSGGDSAGDPADERVRTAALAAALAKINHDIRNVLSTATLAAERFEKVEDPVVKRFLPRVLEVLDKASALASATLNLLSASAPDLTLVRIPLRTLVDDVGRELGARLAWTNDVADGVAVEADRGLLASALLQIGVNASENGAKAMRVSVAVEHGRVHIALADDGPGFAPDAQEKLFTPVLGAARAGGTGLGLVLVREIARAHGGDVRLASTDNDGATISIELPEMGRAGAKARI